MIKLTVNGKEYGVKNYHEGVDGETNQGQRLDIYLDQTESVKPDIIDELELLINQKLQFKILKDGADLLVVNPDYRLIKISRQLGNGEELSVHLKFKKVTA